MEELGVDERVAGQRERGLQGPAAVESRESVPAHPPAGVAVPRDGAGQRVAVAGAVVEQEQAEVAVDTARQQFTFQSQRHAAPRAQSDEQLGIQRDVEQRHRPAPAEARFDHRAIVARRLQPDAAEAEETVAVTELRRRQRQDRDATGAQPRTRRVPAQRAALVATRAHGREAHRPVQRIGVAGRECRALGEHAAVGVLAQVARADCQRPAIRCAAARRHADLDVIHLRTTFDRPVAQQATAHAIAALVELDVAGELQFAYQRLVLR
jgi:hypothetical protein